FAFNSLLGGGQLLNAIYFRNLEALQDVAPTAANEKLIRGYIGSLDKHPAGFADRHGLLHNFINPHHYDALFVWPFSQVVATKLRLPHAKVRSILRPFRFYRSHPFKGKGYTPDVHGAPNLYYDDNVWIGLD